MSNLKSNIAEARRSVRRNKKANPDIFLEYTELNCARAEYEKAKARYEKAKRVWRELGSH